MPSSPADRDGSVSFPGRVGDIAACHARHYTTSSIVEFMHSQELAPGELATRAGVAISALHFYERQGLIASSRTSGNQRRYTRDTLRRVAFIKMSQRLGIPLARIRDALATLPAHRV